MGRDAGIIVGQRVRSQMNKGTEQGPINHDTMPLAYLVLFWDIWLHVQIIISLLILHIGEDLSIPRVFDVFSRGAAFLFQHSRLICNCAGHCHFSNYLCCGAMREGKILGDRIQCAMYVEIMGCNPALKSAGPHWKHSLYIAQSLQVCLKCATHS